MAGVPTVGLPQQPGAQTGYQAPVLQQHQQAPYVYGGNPYRRGNRPDLNPLNSRPAMMVKNRARQKLNEYLRDQALAPFGDQEEIPAMFVLIELMHFTEEPLRTDANRALRDLPVKLSTSFVVSTVWRRQPYEAVPYEARVFPFHVARMMLQQLQNFEYTMYPELVTQGNVQAWRSRPLMPAERVQVAPSAWREPTEQEKEAMEMGAKRLQRAQGIMARNSRGGGSLLVSLDPQRDSRVMDATATQSTKDAFPGAQGYVPAEQPGVPQGVHPQMKVQTQHQQVENNRKAVENYNFAPGPNQVQRGTAMPSDLTTPDPNQVSAIPGREHMGSQSTPDTKQEAHPAGYMDDAKQHVGIPAAEAEKRRQDGAVPPPPPPPTR